MAHRSFAVAAAVATGVLGLTALVQPPAHSRELGAAPGGAPHFVDARSYFTEPDDIARWYDLTFRLRDEFDAICGDTFCEGDYTNYESLGFDCSVEQRTGRLGQCVWVFAASSDEVLPESGEITVYSEAWRCVMPLAAGTPAGDFLSAMSAAEGRALYAPLPGTEQTLYDGLVDCL